ncbi:hypothetical protein BVG81_006700 [Haliangium sp. UPWRP_2]|nr:hypothetical protein BVG81_006700 [Haliangium sp. UPWRP_2]
MSVRLCVVCGDDLPDVHRSHRRYCRARCRMRALRIRERGGADSARHLVVADPRARRLPRWDIADALEESGLTDELGGPPDIEEETAPGRDRPTPQQFGAYQAMFDHFNRMLFDGSLPSVLLTFSSRDTQGYFKPQKWEDGRGHTHEIGMNPHQLRHRPRWAIAAALVHDMCHLWQELHGHPSRVGYHNREWAERMCQLGLIPTDSGQPGGRQTGQRMEQIIDPDGAFQRALQSVPSAHWLPWQRVGWAVHGVPPFNRKSKYSCPNAHGNVWGRPNLWLFCGHCNAEFEEHALAQAGR